ncbi:UvrD-helicase domain-containing protein [Streptococcus equinus]|uniref:UvrD-helicase domain-containing protein n=1 Tax=Streptococcus equinus TaxID=1335 RepID=UPI0008B5FD86|nr:ATP-dependent helicase [Streptococcus equinus]SEI57070.1 DNA helicase-2 / ATP-dependent DNA helicase PcrA [Streptococcus equinus]
MVNEIENIYLVNAPAGSGKTTWIRKQVEKHLLENDSDNILCITYTNRAAEELGKDIDSSRVFFGTIHSFISNYIGNFFEHREIIDLYWELYKEKIAQRINNIDSQETVEESNARYVEKYGALDLETVYSNLKKISYSETQFTSLYYGMLSHDDLLSFTKKVVEKYPVILKKIRDKYQLVFIDEYQDTDADVLKLFYSAMTPGTGKLYLLGDKMQQIYGNYDGSFEDTFKKLNKSVKLDVNYRSTPYIVDILNTVYNDETLQQHSYEKNFDDQMLFKPKVIFTNDKTETVSAFTEECQNTLVLYLTNKERFYGIGVGNLYDSFSKISKYGYTGKYSVVDVLTKKEVWNQDILLSVIFSLVDISNFYITGNLGDVFKIARSNEKALNKKTFLIRRHADKKVLRDKLDKAVMAYQNNDSTIGSFLKNCYDEDIIDEEYYGGIIEDEDYAPALKVALSEIKVLKKYMENPYISTQHGVKGESHDTVLFVAENNYRIPVVSMSKFFDLWSKVDVTLGSFDDFYYAYLKMIKSIENECDVKISKMKADDYNRNEPFILKKILEFSDRYRDNDYYIVLLKDSYDAYFAKRNKGKAQACLRENVVYGVLAAYRLFYVGCSRARKNLAIVIDNADVVDFKERLKNKFESIGFEIEENA